MSDDRWYFSKEQLDNSPSRKHDIDADKELNYRQQATNLIQDMGSRKHLSVNQLCISTAMVYMHRFYVYHSFSHFQWNAIAMASLFLAAKVEEQTRKIEHIIKVGQWCMQKSNISSDLNSETYLNQVQELVMNENILLQTLGFDVHVKHPHAFILTFSDKLKMNKDITKTMYGMASNSLHVTTMCVQYKSSAVACFCMHYVCKSFNHVIQWNEKVSWWTDLDPKVTPELLERMSKEFLADLDKSLPKLKNKVKELFRSQHMPIHHTFNTDRKPDTSESSAGSSGHSLISISSCSTPSSSSSHHQKHHQSSTSNHNVSEPSRIPGKPSIAQPNHHHQSSHPPTNASSSSSSVANGGVGVHTNPYPTIASSQHIKSNSSTGHVVSSQPQQQQQRHPQHQQHHHHRHVPMLPGTSQQAHKILTSGAAHNNSKPKINPVSFCLSTSNGSAAILANETAKSDRRKMFEIRLKADSGVKQGPECNAQATAAAISNHRSAAANDINPKVDLLKDCHKLGTNSRSDIVSNVIKEVTIPGKLNETCNVIKTEPASNLDSIDGPISNDAAATKPSRNHSIFSPSPPRCLSPIDEPIIKRRFLSEEVEIKQESKSKPTNQRRQGVSHSETTPVAKIIEAVTGIDNVKNTFIAVPSAAAAEPLTNIDKISNVGLAPRLNDTIKQERCEIKTEPAEFSTLAPRLDDVTIKQERCEIKTEPVEFSTFSKANSQPSLIPRLNDVAKVKAEPCEIKTEPVQLSTISVTNSQPSLVRNSNENLAIRIDKLDASVSVAGECSSTSHTHKKKKKHKEKDKRHKEKKRHKDDKHRHRSSEHSSSKEKERKDPAPIKITIPKEKLTNIPVKLKIKINRDQMVTPSTSEEVTKNDTAVKKSSEKASKSRKRKRESDHDRSSRKLHCDDVSSQNGYKDCL